jgi:hypothetical protein
VAGPTNAPGGAPRRPANVRVQDGGVQPPTSTMPGGPSESILRPTKDVTIRSGKVLTVREPTAAETMLVYKTCGNETQTAVQMYLGAMAIVAIDGTPTQRTSRVELDYILTSFGTMTTLGDAMNNVIAALNELTGIDVVPKDGETPQALAARRDEAFRENLEPTPATP